MNSPEDTVSREQAQQRRFKTVANRASLLKPDNRPTDYAHLYENKGWTALLRFDGKVDDLEVESFVKKEWVD